MKLAAETLLRRGLLAGIAIATAALAGCGSSRPEHPERIVLIVIDTLRRDHLGCYGGSVATPNIDRLAAEGVRFRNAYSSFHQTSMSMGSLFTGRTPSIETADPRRALSWNGVTWCGMHRFAATRQPPGLCIPESLRTLGQEIAEAGYWTLGVTGNPLLFDPAGFSRGFDDWREVGEPLLGARARRPPVENRGQLAQRFAARSGPRVNAAVAEALDRRESDRFFLYVHYMDAHDYGGGKAYARGAAESDAAVGGLLELLEARGLLEGATVVLTADHGERLEESHPVRGGAFHNGNPSFESVIRTPLIVWPATHAEEETKSLLRSDDLHRWLLALAGVDRPDPGDLEPEELFLTEMNWRTYRRGRWKSAWPRRDGKAILFDLLEDPAESRDVSADHPEVMTRHGDRITALSRRLAAGDDPPGELGEADRERLRVLGYLEGPGDSESP